MFLCRQNIHIKSERSHGSISAGTLPSGQKRFRVAFTPIVIYLSAPEHQHLFIAYLIGKKLRAPGFAVLKMVTPDYGKWQLLTKISYVK